MADTVDARASAFGSRRPLTLDEALRAARPTPFSDIEWQRLTLASAYYHANLLRGAIAAEGVEVSQPWPRVASCYAGGRQ